MTNTTRPVQASADDFDWSARFGSAAELREVVEAAASTDGGSPLDEAALLRLRHRGLEGATLWTVSGANGMAGFALADATTGAGGPTTTGAGPATAAGPGGPAQVEVNLVVHPDHRGQGVGAALAEAADAAFPHADVSAWAHTGHPAARALASRLGAERVRDLWVMRRPLTGDLPPVAPVDGIVVRPFRPGTDEDAWLAVNAAAFAHHPEQGGTTRADLEARMAEPWFDPSGFFLAWKGDRLVGFHWTKVHAEVEPAFGEVYVVGVAPEGQGGGLGKALTLIGLHHLAERGLDEVILYVESDNAPAVAVYARLGFTHAPADTHVMYRRPARG